MEREITAQQGSDIALMSELERLGVFDRAGIDSQPTAATEREARVAILHLGGLRDRKGNPRHRPRRIDSPLLQDKIVQTVLFERAANPKKRMKAIANDILRDYGMSRRYVYECLKEVTPERRRQIAQSIIVSCFWPEMMAHLYKFAATAVDTKSS
jgi:hypothetical protein